MIFFRFPCEFRKKSGSVFGRNEKTATFVPGEVAEWSIAAVLKTVELRGSGGSNPSLSALVVEYQRSNRINPVLYFPMQHRIF